MKSAYAWMLAPWIAFGLAAVAGAEHEDRTAPPTELQQAQHSRDFAARAVCQGQAFEWDGDVLVCFKERP